MSLTGTGVAGGLAGVVIFAIAAKVTGGTVQLTDAGYAFLGIVASAFIGAVATITVAVIGYKAAQLRSQPADPVDEDPDELRRRAAEIERRQKRRGK